MKKIVFLMAVLLMPLVFVSCGGDDDDVDNGKIVGVWVERYTWREDDNAFYDWGDYYYRSLGGVHVFRQDGTYSYYFSDYHYKNNDAYREGTYSFDGSSVVISGGNKRKVAFTEDGNGFEWERTAIVVRY